MRLLLLINTLCLSLLTWPSMATNLIFPPGEDNRFNWSDYQALKQVDLKGETITISGPWLGPDKKLIESVIAYFEQATGATVQYAGSDSFEQQIVIDVQAGSAPNLAVFPQPGLAASLAEKGFLTPLDSQTKNWIEDNYAAGSSWLDLGTYPNPQGLSSYLVSFIRSM